jgi:hypothetical protein
VDNVKYQKCHLGVIYFLLFVDSGHLASARIIFGLEVHVKWLSDTASGIVIIYFKFGLGCIGSTAVGFDIVIILWPCVLFLNLGCQSSQVNASNVFWLGGLKKMLIR